MLSIIILGQRPVDVHAHGRPTAAMPPVHATATACVRARARGPTFCALLGLDVGCQRLQLRIASIIRPWWARAPGARARTRPGWRALAITSDSWHRAPPSECIALRAGSARSALLGQAARRRARTHSPPPCARPCAWHHPMRTREVSPGTAGAHRRRHAGRRRPRASARRREMKRIRTHAHKRGRAPTWTRTRTSPPPARQSARFGCQPFFFTFFGSPSSAICPKPRPSLSRLSSSRRDSSASHEL